MSKLFKGIKKAVKKVFKGIKKIFKKITSSTLGKVLLGAAAIWLGGAAFGLWKTPFASVNGAFTKSAAEQLLSSNVVPAGSAASTAATESAINAAAAGLSETASVAQAAGLQAGVEGATAAATGAADVASGAAMAEGTASELLSAVPQGSAAGTAAGEAAITEAAAGNVVGGAAQGGALQQAGAGYGSNMATTGADSLVVDTGVGASRSALMADTATTGAKNVLSGVGKFTKEHPLAAIMGLNAISGALSPDQMDLMEEQQKQIAKAYDGVGNISVGMSPGSKVLKRNSTGAPVWQGGILQSLRQKSNIYGGG
jgi:hypothetical protein